MLAQNCHRPNRIGLPSAVSPQECPLPLLSVVPWVSSTTDGSGGGVAVASGAGVGVGVGMGVGVGVDVGG